MIFGRVLNNMKTLNEQFEKLFENMEHFIKKTDEMVKEMISEKYRPKLGSENRDEYTSYSSGWNDHREHCKKISKKYL